MRPTMVKMDFNPAALRYFASRQVTEFARGADEELVVKYVNEPSTIDVSDVFISPVTTSLPYVQRVKRIEERFDMVMMCEDAIVLARYRDVSRSSLHRYLESGLISELQEENR